ncbi:MAG TPA: SPW repeat protein [Candidatus Nitrosocosmicus sp.]|nr:SPW repeat protein [Candidatus Nitrosocosmicus sp.]
MDNMKMIPTKVHGILDYATGIALLLAPNLFGFADVGGAAVAIPRILGIMILVQSLMTNYELGVMKMIPMSMHLMVDYVASLFLVASPWLFGFADEPANVWMPHVIVGLVYFVTSLMTQTKSSTETNTK